MGKGKGSRPKRRSNTASHRRIVKFNNARMNEGESGPVTVRRMTDEDYLKHGFKPRSFYQGSDPDDGGRSDG